MKKQYIIPQISITTYHTEDIICASGTGEGLKLDSNSQVNLEQRNFNVTWFDEDAIE